MKLLKNKGVRLEPSVESAILAIREKVNTEGNPAVYTDREIEIIKEAYFHITGRNAPDNCRGICATVFKIVRNWYVKYEHEVEAKDILKKTIQVVTAEKTESSNKVVLGKTMTEPKKPDPIDLTKLKLSELRELYPGIKAGSKKEFIEKLNQSESSEEE